MSQIPGRIQGRAWWHGLGNSSSANQIEVHVGHGEDGPEKRNALRLGEPRQQDPDGEQALVEREEVDAALNHNDRGEVIGRHDQREWCNRAARRWRHHCERCGRGRSGEESDESGDAHDASGMSYQESSDLVGEVRRRLVLEYRETSFQDQH